MLKVKTIFKKFAMMKEIKINNFKMSKFKAIKLKVKNFQLNNKMQNQIQMKIQMNCKINSRKKTNSYSAKANFRRIYRLHNNRMLEI